MNDLNSRANLPPKLRNFINENIDSLGQLQVLMLLYRDPEKQWSESDVSQELGISLAFAHKNLEALTAQCLLKQLDGEPILFHYAPANQEIAAIIGNLVNLYQREPQKIGDLILSRTPRAVLG